jgi:hypothetical protein
MLVPFVFVSTGTADLIPDHSSPKYTKPGTGTNNKASKKLKLLNLAKRNSSAFRGNLWCGVDIIEIGMWRRKYCRKVSDVRNLWSKRAGNTPKAHNLAMIDPIFL